MKQPAKKQRVEEPEAGPSEQQLQQIAVLLEKEEAWQEQQKKVEVEINNAFEAKRFEHRLKLIQKIMVDVPNFWEETIAYNDTLTRVISAEDRPILRKIKDIQRVESGNGLGFRLTIIFKEGNEYFENQELWRSHREEMCDEEEEAPNSDASDVKWKKGKSLHDRNKAKGVKEDDDDAAFSLFELFEEGPLSEEELPVLFALAEIADDPIACYLGVEAEDEEEDEEDEEDCAAATACGGGPCCK